MARSVKQAAHVTKEDWPPPIGATVRTPAGDTFEVVSRFEGDGYPTTVVIRRPIDGGWTARAITRSAWINEALEIVR